jgi:hypothetical protein
MSVTEDEGRERKVERGREETDRERKEKHSSILIGL